MTTIYTVDGLGVITPTEAADIPLASGSLLGDGDGGLDWRALAQACDVEPGVIVVLVAQGLVEPEALMPAPTAPDAMNPAEPAEAHWRFGGEALARVRRIQRLQRDFDASLLSVGLMLDLLDEIDRLHGLLNRAGLRA
jgi:chaperone modulatory protein CbpM